MKKINPKSWLYLIVGIGVLVVGIVLLSIHSIEYEKLRQQMENFVNENNLGEYSWLAFDYVDSDGNEASVPVFRRDIEKGAKDSAVSYALDEIHGYSWCFVHKTGGTVMLVLGMICCCAFGVWFKYATEPDSVKEERRREREKRYQEAQKRAQINDAIHSQMLENERQQAIHSQEYGAQWDTKYFTDPCPYCGHYKVRYAKWDDKRLSVAFWGGASSKIGTRYKCEHCGRMWE